MKRILFILLVAFISQQVNAGNKIYYLQGNVSQPKVMVTKDASVAIQLPELCGIVQFGIIKGTESTWLSNTKNLKVKKEGGLLSFYIKDALLGTGEITLRMKPMKNADGLFIEMSCKDCPLDAKLLWVYGGASNKIQANKDSCQLTIENCKDNVFSIERSSFLVYFGESAHFRVFQGIAPLSSDIRLSNPLMMQTPWEFFQSGKKAASQAISATCTLDNENKSYFAFYAPNRSTDYNYFMLPKLFNE